MTEDTLEKIVLMLVDTPGMMAPADTATKPAINAYSMRSWPWVSLHSLSLYRRVIMPNSRAVCGHGTLREMPRISLKIS